jgi:PRTRC genetic system protein B
LIIYSPSKSSLKIVRNITHLFNQNTFVPIKALVFFRKPEERGVGSAYVEAYDIDPRGMPINAHPLTESESHALAGKLANAREKGRSFLEPEGFIPDTVLAISLSREQVMWYLPASQQALYFKEQLGIPNGIAMLPPLLLKATRNQLYIYALKDKKRPTLKSKLFNAPFFNTAGNGLVCMGSALPKMPNDCSLQGFIHLWQTHFFNSYFSHLSTSNPVTVPIVPLWTELIGSEKPFPVSVLAPSTIKLSSLIDQ